MAKRVVVPRFIDQVCPGERLRNSSELESYKNQRIAIAAKNAAIYYTTLYQTLYDGKMNQRTNGTRYVDPETDPFESSVNGFQPDIVKMNGKRFEYTEVKATSGAHNRFWCAIEQFRNYSADVLNRFGSKKTGVVDYALFRYGSRKEPGLYNGSAKQGHERDHRSLVEKLSAQTKDLLILPLNLMIAMFSTYESEGFYQVRSRNHSTSNTTRSNENYFVILGGMASQLQEMARDKTRFKHFIERLKNPDATRTDELELLCLDDLVVESTTSPGIYARSCENLRDKFFSEVPVDRFRITKFSLGEEGEKRWFRNFKKYHDRMFKEWLKIGPLEEIPF